MISRSAGGTHLFGARRRARVEAFGAHLARSTRRDGRVGLQATIRVKGRTARGSAPGRRACTPDPITPTTSIARGCETSAATAPAAPVRMSVRKPLSSSSATGNPVGRVEDAIRPEPLGNPSRRSRRTGGDFHRDVRHALDMGGLDVELPARGGDVEVDDAGTCARPSPSARNASRIASTATAGNAARSAASSTIGITLAE